VTSSTDSAPNPAVRVGIGGWTYEPWRANFYPDDLPQSRELQYASSKLSAIEINGTYYGTQKRESFERWHDETPDDFIFSMKATRYATNKRVLAEAGDSISRFIDSGIAGLKRKLGPIVWQFMATKRFDPEDFEAFLALLPKSVEGLALRHAMDVRHVSFATPQYVALARKYGVATVFNDSDDYPSFADITGDFVYARLMRTVSDQPTGYSPAALDDIADTVRAWRRGASPAVLPYADHETDAAKVDARDTFVYFISGAKERAPAAAQALLERLRS